MRKALFGLALLSTLVVGIVFFIKLKEQRMVPPSEVENVPVQATQIVEPPPSLIPEEGEVPEPMPTTLTKEILYTVPFSSQAPTGDWSRSEFQDGCEEASAIMVNAWRTGEVLTTETARQELLALARYQEENIGHGVDTDARDTAKLLLGAYFSITDYAVRYDFSLVELKQALTDGVIIVPTNGRLLGNPNFTPPGPLQHMVVIIGYDPVTEEFITNDPGTRKGEGYRYAEHTLYDAIREYPTGRHLPIKTERKAMIVVPALSGT